MNGTLIDSETKAPDRESRPGCKRVVVVAGLGCLPGLVLGIMVGFFIGMWVALLELDEQAMNPLAELKVPPGKLSLDQVMARTDGLAKTYLAEEGNFGLVVGVIRDGERVVNGYGVRTSAGDEPPDAETVFELASVGKTFTTLVLADMHLRDEISWNDALADHLPDTVSVPRFDDRPIRLLDLATHTSGLPSLPPNFEPADPLNPYADYTVEQMNEGLAQIALTVRPGTTYEYSNLGFGLLGNVLARRAATDYEQLVVQRICQPMGMTRTRMTLDDRLRENLATPHSGGLPVPIWEDTTMAGAGSFLSTANDMLNYVERHQSGETDLEPLAQAAAETIRKRRPADAPSHSMGLGWHIDSENAHDIIWHNGGAGGSCSYVAFTVDPPCGVVVLSNSDNSVDDLGHKVLYLLLQDD